jgi:glycosyltransferase involved in cell wall biosynthesis
VVICFYQADATFARALDSALTQHRIPDEVIVVDDGSPPGTARSLEVLPPTIRVIRLLRNSGVSSARRAGTLAAQADLVAYLDADDRWPPDHLERLAGAMDRDPTAPAAYAPVVKCWPDGRTQLHAKKPARLDVREAIVRSHFLPSGLVVRRSMVEDVGGWKDDRWVVDDWHLSVRLIDRWGPMLFVPGAPVEYAVGNSDSLNSGDLRVLRQWWDSVRELGPLLERHYGPGAGRRRFAKALVDRAHRVGGIFGRVLLLAGGLLGPPLSVCDQLPTTGERDVPQAGARAR